MISMESGFTLSEAARRSLASLIDSGSLALLPQQLLLQGPPFGSLVGAMVGVMVRVLPESDRRGPRAMLDPSALDVDPDGSGLGKKQNPPQESLPGEFAKTPSRVRPGRGPRSLRIPPGGPILPRHCGRIVLPWLMVERSPYFCFIRGGWVPAVFVWDRATGVFTHVEGPHAFTTWSEADEAPRFLRVDGQTCSSGNGRRE